MVIVYLNVSSLLSHHAKIISLPKEQGMHFLALDETKLDECCSSELLQIGFKGLDCNRNGNDVAFYIRETSTYTKMQLC